MHGNDAHQGLVAFQAQLLGLAAPVLLGLADGPAQPAQQAGHAEGLGLGGRQQLGDLQVVADAALAVLVGQQALGGLLDQRLQHRQHTVTAPGLVGPLEALDRRLPAILVRRQRDQIAQTIAEQPARQRAVQQAFVHRAGGGLEHVQHVLGLFAGEHAGLVQADRADAQAREGALHVGGLVIGVDQHGDVARLDSALLALAGRRLLLDPHRAGVGVKQAADLGDAGVAAGALGDRLDGLGRRQMPHGHGRQRLAVEQQAAAGSAAGGHMLIVDALDQEGVRPGHREQGLDGVEQALSRAEIGVQAIGVVSGIGRGVQIGVDIAAAKAVDGLLGVADQDQTAVIAPGVDPLQDLVLQRIGVLELIDQGPGPGRMQGVGQTRAAVGMDDGAMQRLDHVGEAELPAGALALPGQGVHGRARVAQGGDDGQRLQAAKIGGRAAAEQRLAARLGFLLELGLGLAQRGGPGRQQRHGGVAVHGPRQRLQGGLDAAEIVDALVQGGCLAQGVVMPAGGQRLGEVLPARSPGLARSIGQGRDLIVPGSGESGMRAQPERLERRSEIVGTGPELGESRLGAVTERVGPPVVGHHLVVDLAVVDLFAAVEGQGAVEGVLLRGALGEAVDGGDGGLVHAVRGLRQAPGHGLARLVAGRDQSLGEPVLGRLGPGRVRMAGDAGGLGQALADALAQLLGGGPGEGHHQDLAHRDALLQDQAQVQPGQAEGLAGAGAGFDQAQAVQRHRLQLEAARRHGGAGAGCRAARGGPPMVSANSQNAVSPGSAPSGGSPASRRRK